MRHVCAGVVGASEKAGGFPKLVDTSSGEHDFCQQISLQLCTRLINWL